MTVAEVLKCSALASEDSERILPPDLQDVAYNKHLIVAIRVVLDTVHNTHVYELVTLPSKRVLDSYKGNAPSHSSSSGRQHSEHRDKPSPYSAAALSFMELSVDRLSHKTGMDVLDAMINTCSSAEIGLSLDPELCEVFTIMTQDVATNLLQFQIRDVSDFAGTSREDSEHCKLQKKAAPRVTELNTEKCLTSWRNMTIALWRAFEFTHGCEWIALLWNIPEQMRLFLGVYHVTRPELNRNGFVTKYLNYCIQSFCQVFGKYSSTIEELETCADHFRVDIDTPHFRRAENVLRSELNSNIETLMAAHKGRGVA
jgi:hypothetical protein